MNYHQLKLGNHKLLLRFLDIAKWKSTDYLVDLKTKNRKEIRKHGQALLNCPVLLRNPISSEEIVKSQRRVHCTNL